MTEEPKAATNTQGRRALSWGLGLGFGLPCGIFVASMLIVGLLIFIPIACTTGLLGFGAAVAPPPQPTPPERSIDSGTYAPSTNEYSPAVEQRNATRTYTAATLTVYGVQDDDRYHHESCRIVRYATKPVVSGFMADAIANGYVRCDTCGAEIDAALGN